MYNSQILIVFGIRYPRHSEYYTKALHQESRAIYLTLVQREKSILKARYHLR